MKKKTLNFLTLTLLAGIVLSFTVYTGIGTAISAEARAEKRIDSFNRTFYGDSDIMSLVDYIEYEIFGYIDGGNVIIGEEEWLFEAVDSTNGYERLLDYLGGCPFSEEELRTIARNLSARQSAYEAENINYILMVIPDSMSVCSDKVPWYLGERSQSARLSQLCAYLAEKGIDCLVDPTEKMVEESADIPMYNNTENSINAYGAYCIYNTAVSRLLAETGREVDRIYREDIDFYTRITDGRGIAALAGLERTIENRTVSLTDSAPDNYEVYYSTRSVVATERADISERDPDSCIVVECADDWDRTQLMPYFSGTFDRAYYRSSLSTQPSAAKQHGATIVVQVLRESELSELLK